MRKFPATILFVALAALALVATSGALPALAQSKPAEKPQAAARPQHHMVTPDQVKWGPAPPSLPPGAQAAIMDGDPTKPGFFTIRVKFPDGYAVPPHWHPTDEYVTVLSGTLMAGMGDKADAASMHTLTAGGFVRMPRRATHYVRAKGETVIQVMGTGPFVVNYVNAADDPRKKTTAQ